MPDVRQVRHVHLVELNLLQRQVLGEVLDNSCDSRWRILLLLEASHWVPNTDVPLGMLIPSCCHGLLLFDLRIVRLGVEHSHVGLVHRPHLGLSPEHHHVELQVGRKFIGLSFLHGPVSHLFIAKELGHRGDEPPIANG